MPLKILILCAYEAASHRRWHQGLTKNLNAQFTVLTLPGRHFAWRVRSNPLWWSQTEAPTLNQPYDLIIATSSVDLTCLRGLVPHLASIKTIVYFHENQLAYPLNKKKKLDPNLVMLDVYNALVADRVVFNSDFNQQSLYNGLEQFLPRLPDSVPNDLLEVLRAKSEVLPIALEDSWFVQRPINTGPLVILWNHRWEYDKGPERFFEALSLLRREHIVHVVGQQFRKSPSCFARERLGASCGHWGYIKERSEYQALLQTCDLVVSTALHEFQGLAVLEAMASGCVAAVPNRLAYKEYVPRNQRYEGDEHNASQEARHLADHINAYKRHPSTAPNQLRWSVMRPRWSDLFTRTLGS